MWRKNQCNFPICLLFIKEISTGDIHQRSWASLEQVVRSSALSHSKHSLYRLMLISIYLRSKGLSTVFPNLALILLNLSSNELDISVKIWRLWLLGTPAENMLGKGSLTMNMELMFTRWPGDPSQPSLVLCIESTVVFQSSVIQNSRRELQHLRVYCGEGLRLK